MRRPFARVLKGLFSRKPKLEQAPPIRHISVPRQRPHSRDPLKGRAKRRRIRKLARASRKRNRS